MVRRFTPLPLRELVKWIGVSADCRQHIGGIGFQMCIQDAVFVPAVKTHRLKINAAHMAETAVFDDVICIRESA